MLFDGLGWHGSVGLSAVDGGVKDADVLDGAIVGVGFGGLDAADDVETFNYFAEYGVGTVEVGSSGIVAIVFAESRVESVLAIGAFLDAAIHLVEKRVGFEGAAPNDVELGGGTHVLGIDVVAFASGGESATLVVEGGVEYLGGDEFFFGFVADEGAWGGVLASGVAALDHEVFDDAMEEERVEITRFGLADEVVAMERSLVVEFENDVALGGGEGDLGARLGFLGGGLLVVARYKEDGCCEEDEGFSHGKCCCGLVGELKSDDHAVLVGDESVVLLHGHVVEIIFGVEFPIVEGVTAHFLADGDAVDAAEFLFDFFLAVEVVAAVGIDGEFDMERKFDIFVDFGEVVGAKCADDGESAGAAEIVDREGVGDGLGRGCGAECGRTESQKTKCRQE